MVVEGRNLGQTPGLGNQHSTLTQILSFQESKMEYSALFWTQLLDILDILYLLNKQTLGAVQIVMINLYNTHTHTHI